MVNLNWQPGMTLESIEKEAILQALRYFRGNKTATATALGFAIRTLDAKLEKYKEDDAAKRKASDERIKREQDFVERSRWGANGQGSGKQVTGNPQQQRSSKVDAEAGFETPSRQQLESTLEVSAQQSVPLSKRKEVQGVSSADSSPSRQVRRS